MPQVLSLLWDVVLVCLSVILLLHRDVICDSHGEEVLTQKTGLGT